MFLLITGASGAGKSTVRRLIAPEFSDVLEAVELAELANTPQWSLRWRHQAVETVVTRALEAQREGKHFLLCGDPVPPGEVCAAPSADLLDGLAVCLLDVAPDAQRQRLLRRGDDPALLPRHVAFAEWMRAHVADPAHRPEVIVNDGWEAMRWDRWLPPAGRPTPWISHVIDTTDQSPEAVAARAAAWIRETIARSSARCP